MNIGKIREKAKELLYAGSFDPIDGVPFIISHTFTNSSAVSLPDKNGNPEFVELNTEENQHRFLKFWEQQIEKMKDFDSIASQVNKPYRMYFLKICKPYMTKAEFSLRLGEFWVMTENPNNDVNVPLKEAGEFFEEADKDALMEKEELKVYKKLPAEFDVYRGVSKGRVEKGFSWTRDLEKAKWFANRFGEGYVMKAHVKKEEVLAYFSRRNEDEYVINSFKIKTERM